MGVPGTPTAGTMAGATGKRHEEATSAQGAGYRRFLQKGGETSNKITGKMAVSRRVTARQAGSGDQPPTGGAHHQKPGVTSTITFKRAVYPQAALN